MPTLYYSPGACSLASHIVLEEIGKPYDLVEVNVRRGDHQKPEYLALNPRGRVPTLRVGGFVLTECPAILAYLDRTHPEQGLLPDDPAAEAQGLSLMSWLASTLHVSFAQVWRSARFSDDEAAHPSIVASGRAAIARHFDDIEGRLGDAGWALGRRYSVVDPYLLVFWRWAVSIGYDAERWPRYARLAHALGARPATQRVLAREGIGLVPEPR